MKTGFFDISYRCHVCHETFEPGTGWEDEKGYRYCGQETETTAGTPLIRPKPELIGTGKGSWPIKVQPKRNVQSYSGKVSYEVIDL